MTWEEMQKHIEALDDDQKKCYIVLYDAFRDVYYMGIEMVENKKISKDRCILIRQL